MIQSVLLKPVSSEIYKSFNDEPQRVTSVEPSRAVLFLDSQQNTLETKKTNIQFSTIRFANDRMGPLASNINTLSIFSAGVRYCSPNINQINNNLIIFSSFTNLFHSVTLTEGFYTTPLLVINEIVTQLNLITGFTGLTFSAAPVIGYPNKYYLNSSGGSYYFFQGCSACKFGQVMYGLPKDTILDNSKTIGSITLYYTRYIDICSSTITKYSKVKNISNGPNSNMVARIFVSDPTVDSFSGLNPTYATRFSFQWNPQEPIDYVDIQLRDEYGNFLYIPSNENNFFWDIAFTLEN